MAEEKQQQNGTRLAEDKTTAQDLANNKVEQHSAKQHHQGNGRYIAALLAVGVVLLALYAQTNARLARIELAVVGGSSSVARELSNDTILVAKDLHLGHTEHIINALMRAGRRLKHHDFAQDTKPQFSDQYQVVWFQDYPYYTISKLLPRQRINHFPSIGSITSKLELTTSKESLPNMLRAFHLPAEKQKFLEFAKTKPSDSYWMQKKPTHRGNKLVHLEQVVLDGNESSIVQEFMSKPLLIDGKPLDIGLYAALTSVAPLRAYIFEAETLIRFTGKPYLNQEGKFNASHTSSYVIDDNYTPIWNMPSLKPHYVDSNMNMKQAFAVYLRQHHNKDAQIIWDKAEQTIKQVFKAKEPKIVRGCHNFQLAQNYNSTSVEGSMNQFFELMRFDFIIDEDLNIFLMEANMTPNLSSRHFPKNRPLYERVLNSFLQLAGVTSYASEHLWRLPIHYLDGQVDLPSGQKPVGVNKWLSEQRYGLDEIINERDLAVNEDHCASNECYADRCATGGDKCKLCLPCMSYGDKLHLKRAIFEQLNRWNFKRILPSTSDADLAFQTELPAAPVPVGSAQNVAPIGDYSQVNRLHLDWFRAKCKQDSRFCSY